MRDRFRGKIGFARLREAQIRRGTSFEQETPSPNSYPVVREELNAVRRSDQREKEKERK